MAWSRRRNSASGGIPARVAVPLIAITMPPSTSFGSGGAESLLRLAEKPPPSAGGESSLLEEGGKRCVVIDWPRGAPSQVLPLEFRGGFSF